MALHRRNHSIFNRTLTIQINRLKQPDNELDAMTICEYDFKVNQFEAADLDLTPGWGSRDGAWVMLFEATGLDGAWLVLPERRHDSRGFFARTFCVEEFRDHNLETHFPQH